MGIIKQMKEGEKCLLKREICYIESLDIWVERYYFGSYTDPEPLTYRKMPPLKEKRYCHASWAPCKYRYQKDGKVFCILPLLEKDKEVRECFYDLIKAYRHNQVTGTLGDSLRRAREELKKMIEARCK